MNAYIYQASLYCHDCGIKIQRDLIAAGKAPVTSDDESTYDSDDYPKGPYCDGGGESDSPQHCDGCQVFLENPLTSDGCEYVAEALAEGFKRGRGDRSVLREWEEYYDVRERVLQLIPLQDAEQQFEAWLYPNKEAEEQVRPD